MRSIPVRPTASPSPRATAPRSRRSRRSPESPRRGVIALLDKDAQGNSTPLSFRIHVICDNAAFHKSRAVQRWVAGRDGRVVLRYPPSRAPEENPVELVFWRLHEAVTRNHRHETINELVEAATAWLKVEGAGRPPIQTYNLAA